MDVFRNARKRKKEQQELDGQDITDRIADKVIEKLTPTLDEKFQEINTSFTEIDKDIDEINKKLEKNRNDIDSHTTQLNAQNGRVDRLDYDSRALLHGISALLSH